MADMAWARDRATGEVHEYEVSFLESWPANYFRVPPPAGVAKTKKPSVRAASSVPEGTHLEGGA